MSPTLTCLALAFVGVDLGYRPAANGGTEFIIQISPATLQALRPGEFVNVEVPREAREARPSNFTVSLGNERLPRELPLTASIPPGTAPIVAASPVLPAAASAPSTSGGAEPISVAPPGQNASSATEQSIASSDPAADPRIPGLAPVTGGASAPPQPDRPWLGMCLLVVALIASNAYVGWLFWDARQRYRGLLARTFSFGQPAANAAG